MMMRAVQITKFGGPEGLEVVQKAIPQPGPKDVLIKVVCAGVNVSPRGAMGRWATSI